MLCQIQVWDLQAPLKVMYAQACMLGIFQGHGEALHGVVCRVEAPVAAVVCLVCTLAITTACVAFDMSLKHSSWVKTRGQEIWQQISLSHWAKTAPGSVQIVRCYHSCLLSNMLDSCPYWRVLQACPHKRKLYRAHYKNKLIKKIIQCSMKWKCWKTDASEPPSNPALINGKQCKLKPKPVEGYSSSQKLGKLEKGGLQRLWRKWVNLIKKQKWSHQELDLCFRYSALGYRTAHTP